MGAGGAKRTGKRGPRMLPGLLAVGGCWNLQCEGMGQGPLGRMLPTQACGACQLARYCSPACQEQHRPLHRVQCGRWCRQQGTAEGRQGRGPRGGDAAQE